MALVTITLGAVLQGPGKYCTAAGLGIFFCPLPPFFQVNEKQNKICQSQQDKADSTFKWFTNSFELRVGIPIIWKMFWSINLFALLIFITTVGLYYFVGQKFFGRLYVCPVWSILRNILSFQFFWITLLFKPNLATLIKLPTECCQIV